MNTLKNLLIDLEHRCYSELEIGRELARNSTTEGYNLSNPEIVAFQNWSEREKIKPISDSINKESIEYWKKRIDEVKNPVFKARYSRLVWQLHKQIIGTNPNIDIAKIYIISILEIIEKRLQGEIELISKIKKALSTSISINDKKLISQTKTAIIKLEDEIGENDKPGLWGFSCEVLQQNRKGIFNAKEEEYIILKLEERLNTVTEEGKNFNVWASECAINLLAPYYKKKNRLDEVHRVLRIHGQAVVNEKHGLVLQRQNSLKKLLSQYQKYGMKEEVDSLLKMIREIGPKSKKEFKSIGAEITFTQEEIDSFVIPFTTGSKEQVFHNLIEHFTPKVQDTVNTIKSLTANFFFKKFFGTSIVDEEGREVANIGTFENDPVGNIIFQTSQDLTHQSMFLSFVFERLVGELMYITDDFIDFIKHSPIVDVKRIPIIRRGIQAYFEKDFVTCLHLLIPQIESAVRTLIELNGGTVLESAAIINGFNLKTFNKLLLDDIVLKSLGEDVQMYFRTLYTDPRGWNLRNKICHGLSNPNKFTASASEHVLHTLIIFGAIKYTDVK